VSQRFTGFTGELTNLIKNGAVGVLPTDTTYGLVCSATDQEAVKRLYDLKKREHKPGTLIAADIDQLVDLGLKARYLKAVEQYWPNPISIIIPCGPELKYIHLGKHSLAVRIPKDDELRKLLQQAGPLLTTSANHPGETPAGTITDAVDYFGDAVDFYVESGDLTDRSSSTVIQIIDDEVAILRQGVVKINEKGEIV
jgi:L-threonylcarbamoyladenylate synthase